MLTSPAVITAFAECFLAAFGAANAKKHGSNKHYCFGNTVSLLLSQQTPGCLTVQPGRSH
jgi:hypothetical protein